jgi:dolichol-phosphate mannosyltransferase
MKAARAPLVSIVCPAKNEARNLDELYRRIDAALTPETTEWEWIVVDDHSTDETFAVLTRLSAADQRVSGVRLSRGFGSHMATLCGLRRVSGQCAVVMASDLQDPPELIPNLLKLWREGAQVVTTVRTARPGESARTILFSRLYVWSMRHIGGVRGMQPGSGTYLLVDRRAVDALSLYKENGVSLHVLISWIGFRQSALEYIQQPRLHGESNWTLAKKLQLMLNSLMAHSFHSVRMLTAAAATLSLAAIGYGVWLAVWGNLHGIGTQGRIFAALLLALGGTQIFLLSTLGEYLWRVLIEARQRPQYLVEATTGRDGDSAFGSVYP